MVAESAAQGASLPRGVEACIHTLPESVVSLIPWWPRCSEEAAVPLSGQTSVKGAAVPTRGRLLLATTNWRFLCRAHFFDFCSVTAVDSCRPHVISFCGRVGRIQLRGLADGGGR